MRNWLQNIGDHPQVVNWGLYRRQYFEFYVRHLLLLPYCRCCCCGNMIRKEFKRQIDRWRQIDRQMARELSWAASFSLWILFSNISNYKCGAAQSVYHFINLIHGLFHSAGWLFVRQFTVWVMMGVWDEVEWELLLAGDKRYMNMLNQLTRWNIVETYSKSSWSNELNFVRVWRMKEWSSVKTKLQCECG